MLNSLKKVVNLKEGLMPEVILLSLMVVETDSHTRFLSMINIEQRILLDLTNKIENRKGNS